MSLVGILQLTGRRNGANRKKFHLSLSFSAKSMAGKGNWVILHHYPVMEEL